MKNISMRRLFPRKLLFLACAVIAAWVFTHYHMAKLRADKATRSIGEKRAAAAAPAESAP